MLCGTPSGGAGVAARLAGRAGLDRDFIGSVLHHPPAEREQAIAAQLNASPPLSCSTSVPRRPDTVPPTSYELGGCAAVGAVPAERPPPSEGTALPPASENDRRLSFVALPFPGLVTVPDAEGGFTVNDA